MAAVVGEVLARPCVRTVLVVDDSSPDGTAQVVRAVSAANPGRVDLRVRPVKQGLGRAYVEAFNWLVATDSADVIVQMDADGSHDPGDIDRLVAALEDPGIGLAIGSRYTPGGGVAGWTVGRRLLSRGGNWYAQLWLQLGVADLTGGFKAWRSDALRRIDIATLASDGYVFQIETTLRAVRAGIGVVEVPITFRDRRAGKSKMSRAIAREAVTAVPKLRWADRWAGSARLGSGQKLSDTRDAGRPAPPA